jgi:hypothetical protein
MVGMRLAIWAKSNGRCFQALKEIIDYWRSRSMRVKRFGKIFY